MGHLVNTRLGEFRIREDAMKANSGAPSMARQCDLMALAE
jgi:hypothetical protein